MKKKQWMEKAIRYDMLKQLYQGDALTAKALKAVFEDAEPVADEVKQSVAGKDFPLSRIHPSPSTCLCHLRLRGMRFHVSDRFLSIR